MDSMATATADALSSAARDFVQAGPRPLVIGGERPEAADGRTFETIDCCFGYAFKGEVVLEADDIADAARLVWGEHGLALRAGENILGRGEEATVRVDEPGVSRRHARVSVPGAGPGPS